MMRYIFFLVTFLASFIFVVFGLFSFFCGKTVMQEIVGGLSFVVWSILWVGSGIMHYMEIWSSLRREEEKHGG